jgi:hypothetical protein
MVVPAAAEQAGLVEVDVGVDETGQGEPAADVDLGRLAGEARFDGGDAPAGDADIDRRREARVRALRKIRSKAVLLFIARRVGGALNLAERRFRGSSRLCAVSEPDCSKYVHAV